MTAGELIKLLQEYDPDLEVTMNVLGEVGVPTGIDWLVDHDKKGSLEITDYPTGD